MNLKPQPKPGPRPSPSGGTRRKPLRAARRAKGATRVRGKGARRPGIPLRQRIAARLPSLRRVVAVAGAIGTTAALIGLLNGPWLRVSDVAWAGERYTDPSDIGELLDAQRGASLLALDTEALQQRLERLPSVAEARVRASLTGRVEAEVTEPEVAFTWETGSARFLGAADGTIFAAIRGDEPGPSALDGLPHITDRRFAARLVTVGDTIPSGVLDIALRVVAIDPATLGSRTDGVSVTVDDEYGFRLISDDPAWEIALGVYGVDPLETRPEAEARLERQIAAVRTLFASRPEAEIGWVDVRNPGKVYFRAKG